MHKWIVLAASSLFFIVLSLCSPYFFPTPVMAQFSIPTCKAGVHLISPSDEHFELAAKLVNGPDGDYCWATLVVHEKEMNTDYLQKVANLSRKHHLQIIYRIEKGFTASGTWLMPDEKTVKTFIDAMSSIIPASKDIYIVLGNEPEHAAMCGGCTPESYGKWADMALDMLHDAPFDAFVMIAGHDLYSPQDPPNYYDAGVFMEEMYDSKPQILCKIDGLASHSYPSNDFKGKGLAVGRYSPRGYQWELEVMTRLAPDGCKDHVKNLSVFITETGYKVGPGGLDNQSAYEHMKDVLNYYANDDQVVASTAFVFIACGEPFTPFAIAGCDGTQLNGVGQAIQEMPKIKGEVQHIFKAQTTIECPKELVENMETMCVFEAKNIGTDIWKNTDDYNLMLVGYSREGLQGPRYSFSRFSEIKPGDTLTGQLRYNPGMKLGTHSLTIALGQNGKVLQALSRVSLDAFESPSVIMESENILGRKTSAEEEKVRIQVFDEDENILFRKSVAAEDGILNVGKIAGVGYTGCYRVVLIVEGSLPVQKECIAFQKGENIVEMPRLFPIDSDKDGKLSLSDILSRRSR